VPLVGPPPLRVVSRHAKRLQQRLPLEKHGILSAPEHVGSHLARVVMLGRRKARYLAARFLTPPV
jgi:hypothetical protein